MPPRTTSFAAIFSREGERDPFFILCVTAELSGGVTAAAIDRYIAQTLIPSILQTIVSGDKNAVSAAIGNAIEAMRDDLGVPCRAYLPDVQLSVQSDGSNSGGGMGNV